MDLTTHYNIHKLGYKHMAKENNNDFEASLFKTADRLRKNIDAAEYKNVVLGATCRFLQTTNNLS